MNRHRWGKPTPGLGPPPDKKYADALRVARSGARGIHFISLTSFHDFKLGLSVILI